MENTKTGAQRILVVEDEPAIRRVLSETLTRAGFAVDTAANGLEAKSRLGEREYDLYLFDIKMAEMNGIQLYEEITKNYSELTKRIVFATGDVIGKDTELFLKKTKRPFLAKPFTTAELLTIVRETLESLEG